MSEYVVKLKNNIQLDSNIKKYLTPSYIFIPVKIKDNAKLLVKDNSYVYKNDLVIDGKNKYFSSISGKVIGIKDMIFKSGIYTTLVIENDYKEAVRKRKGARKKINEYSKMEAIKLLSNFGYDINNINYRTNVLLVNTIELEPFFNINQVLLDKNISKMISTVNYVSEILNYSEIHIAVDHQQSDLIKQLENDTLEYENIKIEILDNIYPIGNKEILMKKLNLKDVAYLNIKELYEIYTILKRNKPVSEKHITITGDAVSNPSIILVKKYSLLSEAFLNTNDFTTGLVDVYINGYLSGKKVDTLKYVIDESLKGIIINKKSEKIVKDCTNCGLCLKYCPKKLNPKVVMESNGEVDYFYKKECINCGLCNYVCPSNIDLKKFMQD